MRGQMEDVRIFCCRADGTDPYENLAYEDALVKWADRETEAGGNICGLFLWQSDSAIVFGRNQSIERECALDVVRKNNIRLVRRTSGGGAVYQDLGNLNYSFVTSAGISDKNRNMRIILSALAALGVKADLSGRNDILAGGRKISGSACRTFRSVSLQHGTMLVNEDLDLADRCLTPDEYKLKTKGICSVRSRIANLSELCQADDVTLVAKQIEAAFKKAFAESQQIKTEVRERDYKEALKMLTSREWQEGEALSVFETIREPWGILRFRVEEDRGAIQEILYETDSLESDFWGNVMDNLKGLPLTGAALERYRTSYDLTAPHQEMLDALIRKIRGNLRA